MVEDLERLFKPRSIALVGVTVSNPQHWTRMPLNALLEFQFQGPIYLVNPKGGEILGMKVHRNLDEIPDGQIDHVISTVPASAGPELVEQVARKGGRSIAFITAGFKETGNPAAELLERRLVEAAKRTRVRIVGPNGMGVYCPASRISFRSDFPKEPGNVSVIAQSGGNATSIVKKAALNGVRFSKVVSYGNAADLNECDFVEYLSEDSETEVIAMYVEGVRDGKRFLRALSEAAARKPVVLLKGGVTRAGARATEGHTGSLAGTETTWDALCRQFGILRVRSLDEEADVLATLVSKTKPKGKRVVLVGNGGGASVLITDEFERAGLEVPELPGKLKDKLAEFTPAAGNILRNPIDYSQNMVDSDKLVRTVETVSRWDGIDLVVGYWSPTQPSPGSSFGSDAVISGLLAACKASLKPMVMVIEASIEPQEQKQVFACSQKFIAAGAPVYYSFGSAARAISLVTDYYQRHRGSE